MSRVLRSIGLQSPATPSDSEDDYYPSTRRTKSSSRPRGYPSSRPTRPRQDSALATIPSPAASVKDDEWDTDYDPRDKYYLTEPESDFDHRAPTSSAVQKYKPEKKERVSKSSKSGKDRSSDKTSSRSLAPEDMSRRDEKINTKSTSRSTRSREESSSDRRKSSLKPESSSSRVKDQSTSTSRPRPRAQRATSSYTRPARPGLQRNPSSAIARSGPSGAASGVRPSVARARSGNVKPRPAFARKMSAVLGGSSARSEPRPIKREKVSSMGYVALAAGVAELLKCATDGSPLIMKGMSAGTAALGAVAIDSLLKPKHEEGIRHEALRSVAEVAIAHAVMTPILSRCSKTVRSNC